MKRLLKFLLDNRASGISLDIVVLLALLAAGSSLLICGRQPPSPCSTPGVSPGGQNAAVTHANKLLD